MWNTTQYHRTFNFSLEGKLTLKKKKYRENFIVMTINYSPFTKCMIFIGWLFLWFTVFPPLNSFLPWIDSAAKIQFIRKKLKFAAPIWIFYNSKIQKRIVSAETICRNTVCIFDKGLDANKVFSQNDRPLVASSFMRVCSYAFHLKSIANHILWWETMWRTNFLHRWFFGFESNSEWNTYLIVLVSQSKLDVHKIHQSSFMSCEEFEKLNDL